MIVYKYDTQTKEFIQDLEINEAYGTNLPFTTTVKPLAKKDGFAICFNNAKWEYIEDNRDKTIYVKATKEELKVDYLGKIKDEHTLLVPKQFDKWNEATKGWIEDVEAKDINRIAKINSKANEIIEARYSFVHKQANILAKRVKDDLGNHYNDDDILEMNTFIDNILLIGKQAKVNGTAVEDIDWNIQ